MKNFRVGNIIEVKGHLTVIYECCHDIVWFYDSKGNVDFLNVNDERIQDVELSNFLLDKMFREERKKGFESFYYVWVVSSDLGIEIRQATEGYNISCMEFEMFKIFTVREFQNVYAILCENPIIGCSNLRNDKPIMIDKKLRKLLKIE